MQLGTPPYEPLSALSSPSRSSLRRLDFPSLEALESEYSVERHREFMRQCEQRSIVVYFRDDPI